MNDYEKTWSIVVLMNDYEKAWSVVVLMNDYESISMMNVAQLETLSGPSSIFHPRTPPHTSKLLNQ